MKHLIILLALSSCAFGASAQGSSMTTHHSGTAPDTLTNATSATYYLVCKGPKSSVTFQYNIDKVSGTVGGTIIVYGSIETTPANYALVNSYTITDADAVGGYSASYNGYTKYKIVVTTTGTQVSSYDIWSLYRN